MSLVELIYMSLYRLPQFVFERLHPITEHDFSNARILVKEGEETILKREWNEKIKRDGV